MDKKSLLGLLIIGVILFGFTWYNSSQQEEFKRQKEVADSIELAQRPTPAQVFEAETITQAFDSANVAVVADSVLEQHLGSSLYLASQGKEQLYTAENDLIKLVFSSKGGKVASVELKNYKTYKGQPLNLFAPQSAQFDLAFFLKQKYNDVQINTQEYHFTPVGDTNLTFAEGETQKQFTMRLNVDSTSYLDYVYTISRDNYMVDFDIKFVGMSQILSANQGDLGLTWGSVAPQNEKGFDNENNYTTIAYNYPGNDGIEELGMSKETKSEDISTKLKWVAFKQQFFSSILVADSDFANGDIKYETFTPNDNNIKKFYAKLSIPFTPQTAEYKFNFYFGPNKFSTLKQYDLHFEKLIPLGGWVIGWVNRWIVIPVFDILGHSIANYGIIILLLTIFIKILISPLTYKSYLSTAKMRLLKPDIDKLGEKYPKQDDAMKKQQATMALYKSAGVNPMGGCIPMLIQFPILIAMFRFFPASIELRGEHFLWADDLSSYDSILQLPFDIPLYGSHVSLFALLMAVSVYVSSKINYTQTASAGPQMAGMKFMMLYMMPVMLLVWFNKYSSGLSYYYLVSNLFTIAQTYAFRYAIDDQKLHAKMKENAKKPQKKSKWQQRYDDMIKQQQQAAGKKNK